MREVVKHAEEQIHSAYVSACEKAGEALNPEDLDLPRWAVDLLAEAYEAQLQVDQQEP